MYPPEARDLGLSGKVELLLSIDETGRVTDAAVTQGVHPLLDRAAQDAAKRLRFDPALAGGVPVASQLPWTYGFTLGFAGNDTAPTLATIHGTVTDADGLEVPGVTVTVQSADPSRETVTFETGPNGRFTAPFLAAGEWRVILVRSGFTTTEYWLDLNPGETVTTDFVLQPQDIQEFVVVGIKETWRDVERGAREVEQAPVTGLYELTRRDIEGTPGSLEDIARAAHALPGVVGDGDLLAGFHVRGGEQSDVVFLLDRVPLDNPFHLAGFNSVFNPDMIHSVKFYAGAPPADVPSTTSAVMAVESWDGAPREAGGGLDGAVDISASSARAMVMGPVDDRDKVTVALAARRTYLEGYFQVMKWANLIDTAFAAPEYSELSARVAWRPHSRHRLMLTLMRSGDSLALVDSDDDSTISFNGTFELKNALYLVSIDDTLKIGGNVEWRRTLAYTDEVSRTTRSVAGEASQEWHVQRVYGRSDVVIGVGDHEVKAGVDGAWLITSAFGRIEDRRAVPTWAQAGIAPLGLSAIDSEFHGSWPEASGYGELGLNFPVRVRAGVRGTYSGLSDRFNVSPRAGLSVPLNGGATVPKLSWGVYHKTPRDPYQLDSVLGNPDLREERAQHFVAGIDQAFPLPYTSPTGERSGGLLRVEGYHVRLDHLVVNPDTRAAVNGGTHYENVGSGTNTGVDVMVAARTPRWGATATYGLLFAVRHNPLNTRFTTTVRPPQDQRHTLGLAGEWQPLPHWRFTLRYAYHSGRPISPVAVASEDTVRITSLNCDRLGPTHNVDFRAEWQRAYRGYKLTMYLELLNVGNVQSQFLPIHDVIDGELSTTMLKHLPMRPFLGLRADF